MVSWMMGWSDAAFPYQSGGYFWVDIFSPVAGGLLAAVLFIYIIEPAMKTKKTDCDCKAR